MNRPTVLILTSDPAFSQEITANWPRDARRDGRELGPEFTVLDPGFRCDLEGSQYDLAIADVTYIDGLKSQSKSKQPKPQHPRSKRAKPKQPENEQRNGVDRNLAENLNLAKNQERNPVRDLDLQPSLEATGKPAILVHSNPASDFYSIHGAVLELRREPGLWPTLVGLIGREILRRRHAEARVLEAEKNSSASQAEATLGRYMVEMRTNVNNALTTVLGNAELLVHEPGLPAHVSSQADAIRNMALRLHEVFQRFASLEKELTFAARESGGKATSAKAGSY
ncbi:MAG: hypothetical protein WA718_02815 [Terriglobales bacterium]